MEKEPKEAKKERSMEELAAEFDSIERDFWSREVGRFIESVGSREQKVNAFELGMSQAEKDKFYQDKERREKLEEIKRSIKQSREFREKPFRTWDQRELD